MLLHYHVSLDMTVNVFSTKIFRFAPSYTNPFLHDKHRILGVSVQNSFKCLTLKTKKLFAFAHKQRSLNVLILGAYIVEELSNNLAKIYYSL